MGGNVHTRSRRSRVSSAVVLLAALLLSACAPASAFDSATSSATESAATGETTTLTLASVQENNSFDPAELEIGHRVHYWMPVYDTLLVLDPDSSARANLATEWRYNDDATVLRLTLREGVTFTDGQPFNAAAVRSNLEHLANGSGQNAYMAASIERYDIIDDHRIDLVLHAPDPGLIGYLGVVGGAMASPAALANKDLATRPVGSGPYVLESEKSTGGSQYVYVRNDDYWNPDAFPYDSIIIRPMSETSARMNALRSGQVDAALAVAASIAEAQAHDLDVHTTQVNWLGLFIVDRDGTQVPALSDVRVRRAINMIFDTEAIVTHAMLGEGTLTTQIFNPSSQAFDARLDDAYTFDTKQAKALMAEAGYADGFTVQMPRFAAFANLNPLIEQGLGELGIEVEWVTEQPDGAVAAVLSARYPMFFFQLGSQSSWQDIRKTVLADSPWNPFRTENEELTALVTQAQHASGDEQAQALRAVNAWLVDEAWFAPWYRENTIYLTNTATHVTMQSQNVVPWIRDFSPASPASPTPPASTAPQATPAPPTS